MEAESARYTTSLFYRDCFGDWICRTYFRIILFVFFIQIREGTNTRIIFPNEGDDDKEVITIIGKKEDAEKAKEELETIIQQIVSFPEKTRRFDFISVV